MKLVIKPICILEIDRIWKIKAVIYEDLGFQFPLDRYRQFTKRVG